MASIYILYSKSLDKFYIGFTNIDVNERMDRHNNKYYENKFTASAQDWKIVLQINQLTNEQARKIEQHIKNMKSKTYINNLIKYHEMVEKLKIKYA